MSELKRWQTYHTETDNWSVGAGNYDAQRQLDYVLRNGVLTKATPPPQRPDARSSKKKDSWTDSTSHRAS